MAGEREGGGKEGMLVGNEEEFKGGGGGARQQENRDEKIHNHQHNVQQANGKTSLQKKSK